MEVALGGAGAEQPIATAASSKTRWGFMSGPGFFGAVAQELVADGSMVSLHEGAGTRAGGDPQLVDRAVEATDVLVVADQEGLERVAREAAISRI